MKLSDNLAGAQFMTIAMLGFTISDTFVKILDKDLPLFQLFLMRGVLVILCFFVLIYKKRPQLPSTSFEWRIILARGCVECLVAWSFFTALRNISLTDATTILQLLPLVMTVFAYFIFGEKFGYPRLIAIIVGFIGVVLVVQPSFTEVNSSYFIALFAMLLIAVREMLTSKLAQKYIIHLDSVYFGLLHNCDGGNWHGDFARMAPRFTCPIGL